MGRDEIEEEQVGLGDLPLEPLALLVASPLVGQLALVPVPSASLELAGSGAVAGVELAPGLDGRGGRRDDGGQREEGGGEERQAHGWLMIGRGSLGWVESDVK